MKGATIGPSGRQLCIGCIQINSPLILTTPIDLCGIDGLCLRGLAGYTVSGIGFIIQTDAEVVFDLSNSRNLIFDNLVFNVTSGYSPGTVILLARDTTGGSVGDSVFQNLVFIGDTDYGFVYNYGSELNQWLNCKMYSNSRLMTITASNIEGLSSSFETIATGGQSMSGNNYQGCSFYRLSSPSGASILLDESQGLIFAEDYFSGATEYAFEAEYSGWSNSISGMTIRDSRFECLVLTSTTQTGAKWILGLSFTDNALAQTGLNFDLNKNNLLVHGLNFVGNKLWDTSITLEFWKLFNSNMDFSSGFNFPTLTINPVYYYGDVIKGLPSGNTQNTGTISMNNSGSANHYLLSTPTHWGVSVAQVDAYDILPQIIAVDGNTLAFSLMNTTSHTNPSQNITVSWWADCYEPPFTP